MRTIANTVQWILKGKSSGSATLQTLLVGLLVLATNVLTGIITARTLGPVGRGEQAAMILWPQFLAYTLTLGLPRALLYNLKCHPDEESDLLSAALVLSTAMSIVAILVGVIFIPQWLAQYSAEAIYFAQWFMLAAPLNLLGVTFTAALEARSEFTFANQVRYLAPLLTLVILGGLLAARALTPFTAGLAYALPGLPILFWLLTHFWSQLHPHWQRLGVAFKRLTSYGLRAYGIDLLGALSGQIDQALVVGLLAPASMGMYVVALSLSRMLRVLQNSIVTVLFPKVTARPVEEVVMLVGRAMRVSLTLTLLASISVMLLGPVVLRLLYGSEYLGAVPVFRILLVEVVVGGATWVLAQAFMALGRPGTVAILQGIGLGLSIPLMLLLIPTYGLVGAGLALLGSTTVRLVFVLISYPLILKVRPPGLLITKKDVQFVQQMLLAKA